MTLQRTRTLHLPDSTLKLLRVTLSPNVLANIVLNPPGTLAGAEEVSAGLLVTSRRDPGPLNQSQLQRFESLPIAKGSQAEKGVI